MPDLSANASRSIGKIEPGCEIFGFTKGQFSIADVIEHLIEQIGPARCTISTWTASGASIERAFRLFNSGKLETCRFLFDAGFRSRQPEFCDNVVRRFGLNSIRTTRNHAKFVVLRNDTWNLVVRTSMNLNANPRLENFEISDDREFAEFFDTFVDDIFERFGPDQCFELAAGGGLDAIGEQGLSESDLMAAFDG